jgi:hypothetical protein
VAFEDGVSIRRRSLDTRRFVMLDLDLSGGEGAEHVRERIREADVEDAVVIVTIEGEGGEVPAAGIEEFATDRGALLARVNDRREFEAEDVPEVRFADPDDAVRDRLREMGPSEAALGIDETVRDDTVADSNVRGQVVDHVRSLLEGDEDAFETAADIDPVARDDDGRAHGEEPPDDRVADGPESQEADDPEAQVTMEDYL